MTHPSSSEFLTATTVPAGAVDIVIDSDTGNETDDQFALVYALCHPERFRIRALCAAPFCHERVLSLAEGRFQSYWEMRRILHYFPECDAPVWEGADRLSREYRNPEACTGALRLVELSQAYHRNHPLWIVGIASLTNIALALRIDPTLAERTVLVWLGGQLPEYPSAEFNLDQDPEAAAQIRASDLPLIQFPCRDVAQKLTLSLPQARELLGGHAGVGRFLLHRYERQHYWSFRLDPSPQAVLSIWDLAPFAWFCNPDWCRLRSIIPGEAVQGLGGNRGVQIADRIDREAVFADFAAALAKQPPLPAPAF